MPGVFIMKITTTLCLLIGICSALFAQDVEIRLHENVLNTVVGALAPLSGEGDFQSPLGSGRYTWTLKNPKLTVKADGLNFLADTHVIMNGIPYTTVSKGQAKVNLNEKNKKIELQITHASFALQFVVFGNKIHLTDIDISSMVNQKFALDTPTFNQVVQIPAEGMRPTKNLTMTTGIPSIGFSAPFLVVSAPLVVTEK
jgi:hypothetical protein